jgi:hypothetical protein
MTTTDDTPQVGDTYDSRTGGDSWLTIDSEVDDYNYHHVTVHRSDGTINRSAFHIDGIRASWRKRIVRPPVPKLRYRRYRWVSNNGSTWDSPEYNSLIRIDLVTGEAVWWDDGTPLTDDERKQLAGES